VSLIFGSSTGELQKVLGFGWQGRDPHIVSIADARETNVNAGKVEGLGGTVVKIQDEELDH